MPVYDFEALETVYYVETIVAANEAEALAELNRRMFGAGAEVFTEQCDGGGGLVLSSEVPDEHGPNCRCVYCIEDRGEPQWRDMT